MSLLQEKKNFTLQEHLDNFTNPIHLSQNEIEDIITNEKNYPKIFQDLFITPKEESFPVKHITDELEIFHPSIYNQISKCHTPIGDIYVKKILNSPNSNINTLKKRQEVIQNIFQNFSEELDKTMSQIKNNIQDVFWFFKPKNEHSDNIYNTIFFNTEYLKFLNKYEPFLTISNAYKIIVSPLLSALSPLVYIIVPFVVLRLMKIKLPFSFFAKMMWQQSGMISLPFVKNPFLATVIKYFSKFLSIFLYGQNVYNSYMTSKTTLKIVNLFQSKLENIREILSLNSIIRKNDNFSNFLGKQVYPNCFMRIENDGIYNKVYSILSNKGKILRDYYEFIESKDDFLKILNNIGVIDCYFGIAKLIKEKSYFNIPKIVESKSPSLELEGIWHPAIPKDKNVKNNISFTENKRNYLLTGPNAAGKSTFIKSVFLNIYLAQTFGICNSEKMEFTPFCYLLTGIRNKDSQGSESLFEAEVNKIRDYLNHIRSSGQSGFTFSILDEIFTSTNYEEGFSASCGLCETIGKMKNSLHIVATHYTKLYKMEKRKGLGFKNIKFSVDLKNDKIEFPYKLEKGYSKQFIALKLIKDKDCDNEFLINCIKYLDKNKKSFGFKKNILKVS